MGEQNKKYDDAQYHNKRSYQSQQQQIDITIDTPSKKAAKYHQRHRVRRKKQKFLIPISENTANDETIEIKSISSSYDLLSEKEIDYEIRMKTWNKECHEYFDKMAEISQFIETTSQSTRTRIWEKFDKQNK